MTHPTRLEVWRGRDESPMPGRPLRAGPLTAELHGVDLRYVKFGDSEIVRRIYVAARDPEWNTIPGTVADLRVTDGGDRFAVEFDVHHDGGGIDFGWHGHISGDRGGTIRYAMEGMARADFRYNRIGLCVLHPYAEYAGRPYRGQSPRGAVSGVLPLEIGPQRVEAGRLVALFPAVDRLVVALAGGLDVEHRFEGDLFEMEDQRNWTDASFKTYCTPLALGVPHAAAAGQRLAQSVSLSIGGKPPAAGSPAAAPTRGVRLYLGSSPNHALPPIGFGMASHGEALSETECERLRSLRAAHLRVDLDLTPAGSPWEEPLAAALRAARRIGSGLELAVFASEGAAAALGRLAEALRPAAGLAVRALVFEEGGRTATPEETTPPSLLALARRILGPALPGVTLGGGTDMYFCELNRTRPQVAGMDALAYSVVPQVHAFDDTSLVENLQAQGETVRSARVFSQGAPIAITPVTLRPRRNPHATGSRRPAVAPAVLPDEVDPRQMSLFGAVWTIGSVKYLAEAGAGSLTYFETTGWRGLMESASGPPLPAAFPSRPGMTFPLYHVFADLAEWQGGRLLPCESDQPLAVIALAMAVGEETHLLVGNLTGTTRTVTIGPLAARQVRLRRLDAEAAEQAMWHADRFRRLYASESPAGGELRLEIPPYASVRIDA